MKVLFQEKQRFNQWWVWAIIVTSTIVPFAVMYRELEKSTGHADIYSLAMRNLPVVITLLVVVALFLIIRLTTVVSNDAIRFVFFPFVWKTIRLSDIANMDVVNYGFVGGWGIRLFTSYGTVYNVRGNKGLQLQLKNGKQLLVGTQKPEELERVIKKLSQHGQIV